MVAKAPSEAETFFLPDLGEGLEDAELVEWCVHVGQQVRENDILAKMETAKALVDIPSPRGGVIAALHGKPGETIKVGAPLVSYRAAPATSPQPHGGNGGQPRQAADAPPPRADAGTVVGNISASEEITPGQILAAPAVRRLARELGVALEEVHGTGIGGRITAEDVRAALTGSSHSAPVSKSPEQAGEPQLLQSPLPSPEREAATAPESAQRIPFRGVRKTIADHLHHSVTHAVHFTVMDEADITNLENLRRKLMAASNEKITVLPFVASAVCQVLSGKKGARFARLNSTVDDQKQEIVQHNSIHLGIATDTESGLMVPVIRDAQRLGVLELARQIARLAAAARDRSIGAEQLHGSTFTLSNFGTGGGRFGTPIINYPEAAILAMGRTRDGVVVRDGMLGVGRLLPLSLSADHRVIDGVAAATALSQIIELLQSPEELLAPVR